MPWGQAISSSAGIGTWSSPGRDARQSGQKTLQAHTFDFLKTAARGKQRFDLVLVDPPSYSATKTRNVAFDIVRDHPRLLEAVVDLLRPGATLFFSTNHQRFDLRIKGLKVSDVTEITASTIPEDYLNKQKTVHRCWRILV